MAVKQMTESETLQRLSETLQRLVDVEEIKKLKARYFRLMDTKQFDEMYSLFTDDLETVGMSDALERTAEASGQPDEFGSAEAFVDRLREQTAAGHVLSVHHGHMPEIEITSPTTARGVWALFDYVEWPQEWTQVDGVPQQQYGFRGYAHYHEEYRKEDGMWKIARMRLPRHRSELLYTRAEVFAAHHQADPS